MMLWIRAMYVFAVTGCVVEASHSYWLGAAAGLALTCLMPPIQVKK
jgi:membrane protein DedA with SNARE-associated domain